MSSLDSADKIFRDALPKAAAGGGSGFHGSVRADVIVLPMPEKPK